VKGCYPIALSVDLEFWWCSELLKGVKIEDRTEIIQDAARLLLDELSRRDCRATFFILGEVAEKYPALILDISKQGHEIANHGASHRNVFEMTPTEFEEEVRRSTEVLADIVGQKPIGFRAPNFSFDQRTVWAYDILKSFEYRYSSSVFPFKTRLYGVPKAPLQPYSPSASDICRHDPDGDLLEFPASVYRLAGINVPVSGGFYFRLLPVRFLRFALTRITTSRPAVLYLHLRDIYPDAPRISGLPLSARVFHYWGLNKALEKLRFLLNHMKFTTVKNTLGLS